MTDAPPAPATITPPEDTPVTRRRDPGALGAVAFFVIAAIVPFVYDDGANLRTLSMAFLLGISALGVNLLTGYTGQVTIGHAAFYGIGAYLSGSLTADTSLTYFSTIPIAVVAAVVCGAIVGLPALRVKGPALALVTLGLALAVPTLLRKYAAGPSNLWQPKADDLASPFEGIDNVQWRYLLPLAFLAVSYVLLRNLIHSRSGRAMIATRDYEASAATSGINVAGTTIAAFAISAGFCGLAGSLSVMVRGQADVSSSLAYFQLSIYMLIAVVVGGVATNGGPIAGALIVQILLDKAPDWSEGRAGMAPFILGAALVALLFLMPDGIFGGIRRVRARLRRSRTPSRPATPATEATS